MFMKQSLVAFALAFVLSLVFSFISLFVRVEAISAVFNFNSAVETESVLTFFGTVVGVATLALFFGVFYLLAKTKIVLVEKSVVLALLLGFALGSASPYLISIIGFQTTNLVLLLSLMVSSLVSSVSAYFFPSLSALLFVKLTEKKPNSLLTEKMENQGQQVSELLD
jgi:hypothetical protein